MKMHGTEDDAICSCKVCHIWSVDTDNCGPLLQGLKFLYVIYTKSLLYTQIKFIKKKKKTEKQTRQKPNNKTPIDLTKIGMDHVILPE